MCVAAAEGLRIKRGREYSFLGEKFNERVKTVANMSLALIPSHHLDCERNLAVVDINIENKSNYSNRHFKARCTRDNLKLDKSSQVKRIK